MARKFRPKLQTSEWIQSLKLVGFCGNSPRILISNAGGGEARLTSTDDGAICVGKLARIRWRPRQVCHDRKRLLWFSQTYTPLITEWEPC